MKYNNAESTLAWDITASGTAIVLKTGEWDLFPSTGYPEKFKIEHFEGSVVTKREVLTVSWRTGDILTISDRASEPCVQDESLATKTRTQEAYSFSSGDTISMTITESDYNGVNTELGRLEGDKLDIATYNSEKPQKWSSTVWTDSYQATISTVSSYVNGQRFLIEVDVSNTWNATFEANALWAKAIKIWEGWVFIDIPTDTITAWGFMNLTYIATWDFFQYTDDPWNVTVSSSSSTQSDVTLWESVSIGDALRNWNSSILRNIDYIPTTENFDSFDTWIWNNVWGYTVSAWIYTQTWANSYKSINSVDFCASWDFDIEFLASITATNSWGHAIWLSRVTNWAQFSFNSVYNINSTNTYINHDWTNVASLSNFHDWNYHTWRITRVWTTWTYYIDWIQRYIWSWSLDDLYFYAQNYDNGEALRIDYINYEKYTPTFEDSTKVFKTDASDSNKTNFIWFANESWNLDDVIKMNTAWVDWNQTFLEADIWNNVYLSDTPWEISTTPWANVVKVGKILSTTEVEIYTNNQDSLNWESTTSATTGWVTLWNAEGYITIKVNGVDKKIPYYWV